jgi:hypothetical protein
LKKSDQTASEEEGKYLYADYSPFDENKNFVAMLKDFARLSSSIFQIHKDLEILDSALAKSELLQQEILSEIERCRKSSEIMTDDYNIQSNKMVKDHFPIPSKSGEKNEDLFLKTKDVLMQRLKNVRDEYSQKTEEYQGYLKSKISNSQRNAINLLQNWLSNDPPELPYITTTSKVLNRLEVSIDNLATTRYYTIAKTTTVTLASPMEEKSNSPGSSTSMSYSLSLSGSNLDFWNSRKRVSDVGVKDVLIPFGLKTPLTEKIRQSLRGVPGISKEPAEKEPGFVNVDGYFIVSVELDDKDKTLSVQLANNPLELEYNMVRITYDVHELYTEKPSAQRYLEGNLPKINCILKEGEVEDVLQKKEIAESTDISKIILFGRVLMDKMKSLSDPSLWASSKSKLVYVEIDKKDAVAAPVGDISSTGHRSIHYSPERVAAFLEAIASNFAPLVRKIEEKSAVKGELILRYEKKDGSREEHTVKIAELNSLLSASDDGKKISNLLFLSSEGVGGGASTTAA